MFSFGGQAQQQQQQQGGGLFGQQQQSPSPFGVAPPIPGQPASTGLFGSSTTTGNSSFFGAAPQPTGGLFGQPASTAASPFGQPAGGMFGQQPAAGGGLFGSQASVGTSPTPSAFGAAVSPFGGASSTSSSGTAGQKYQSTRDTELNMRLVTISAMDFYKNKSLEELRWEDYQANRGVLGSGVASGWGAPAAQPASGMFGASSAASTAGGGAGLFGASSSTSPSPASTGLFGGGTSQPSAFGASGSLFGASTPNTAGGGLFGSTASTQPATGGGLFGSSTSAQPATTGGGLFGSSTPAATGGGLFGSSASTQPATGGGLFGSSASTQPATGGGLFGSSTLAHPTSTGGGLFGSSIPTQPTSTGGGLFGSSTLAQPTSTGGGLFGSSTLAQPATSGGGLFGASTTTTGQTGGGGLFGASSTGTGFGSTSQQPAVPSSTGGGLFGSSSSSAAPNSSLFGGQGTPAQPTASSSLFAGGSAGLFGGSSSSTTTGTTTLFGAGGGLFGASSSASATAPASGSGLGFAQGSLFGSPVVPSSQPTVSLPPVPRPTGLVVPKALDKDSLTAFLWKEKSVETTTPVIKKKLSAATSSSPKTFVPAALPALAGEESNVDNLTTKDSPPLRLRESSGGIVVKPTIVYTTPTKSTAGTFESHSGSQLPKCANHNLWTKPSLEAMEGMTELELSRIEHFQIGHYGIGSVTWPGLSDVRFLDMDSLIIFKKGAVTLFPDEELKPPQGTGLNKTAIIELQVRPKNLELAKQYEARYVDEMKKLTAKNGAEFLSYDLETWRFRVEHFSTWGIEEADWLKIDRHHAAELSHSYRPNDLSLFSRLEQDLAHNMQMDEQEQEEEEGGEVVREEVQECVGALSVAPPTREELKAMGWELRILDLFLNQSFRASLSLDGRCWTPEHPVVCNTFNLIKADYYTSPWNHGNISDSVLNLVVSLFEHRDNKSWQAAALTEKDCSLFSLIQALTQHDDQGSINTVAFNEWLSAVNAKAIQKDPKRAFSAAAAMCSRHYAPSASELLVKGGCPRLALAAAAAMDDASRAIMKSQMKSVADSSDLEAQAVADILGGRCDRLREEKLNFDWKSELALRYWYSEGDLTGFEPPADSIEWRIIKAVVLKDAKEIVRLVDIVSNGEDLFLTFAALWMLRLKNVSLVSDSDLSRVILACSDYALMGKSGIDWQLSPVMLSFLPHAGCREQLIKEIISRKKGQDCSLLAKLGFEVVDPQPPV